MGPVSLSLNVGVVHLGRIHSSTSSYPAPCSLSRLRRKHNFPCLDAAADDRDHSAPSLAHRKFFFCQEALGSRKNPKRRSWHTITTTTTTTTIVCRCSPWPYQAWEMLLHHQSADASASWQEDCAEWMRNGRGFEVLAMALGFGLSLVLAAASSSSSHGSFLFFSIPLFSFVFFLLFSTAVIILLRQQRKNDVAKVQEPLNGLGLGAFVSSRIRVLQATLVKLFSSLQATLRNLEASVTEMMETYRLPVMSISDGLVRIHESIIQLLVLEKPLVHEQFSTLTLKNMDLSVEGSNSSTQNLKKDIPELEDVSKRSTLNSNIEEVVTDLAKYVAQLAQVVASLEGKIANLEMTQFPSTRVVNSELVQIPEPDLEICDASLVSEMSFERVTSSEPSISAEEDLLLPNALEFTSDVKGMDTTTMSTGKSLGELSVNRIATLGTHQASKDSPIDWAIKFHDQITELRGDSHITNIIPDTSADGDGVASISGNSVMIHDARNLVPDTTPDIPREMHVKEFVIQDASPALDTTMRPNSFPATRHDDLIKCVNADPQVLVPSDCMALDDKRNEQMVYAYGFNRDEKENSGVISRQASSLDSGSEHHEYHPLLFDSIKNGDKDSKQVEDTRDGSIHTRGFRKQSNLQLQKEHQTERATVPIKSAVPLRRKQMEVENTQFGANLGKFMYAKNAGNEQVRRLEEDHKEPTNGYVGTERKYEWTQNGEEESSSQSGLSRRILTDKNLSSTSWRNQDGHKSKHGVLLEDRELQVLGGDGDFFGDADVENHIGREIRDKGEYKEGRQRQVHSNKDSDFDQDTGKVLRAASSDSELRPSSPSSYPSDVSKNYRNLAVVKIKELDDERFWNLLDEIEALLNDGQEGLEGRIEVGVAERKLYEAADLCAKAITIRPSSLVAVGVWGNTLLLHGELKLRLSRNLRSMLLKPRAILLHNSWEAAREKEGLEQALQEVCEECEELLVEAGRKFHLALSLDRRDMRALYNWGLALCHCAQLISEEGRKTSAQDADRVYLAAIDKFEAMMGTSQKYAPGALLNWGLAMWDRSHLRPLGSKDRMKLLAQAKVIFKEALQFDPNYGPARGALVACTSELKELEDFEEPQNPRYQ